MARKPHKYHYIYKTTCNVTGKYYIGMYSCSTLEDGYMGSGKKLRRSLNKHGIENHTKEILEFLDDRESLAKRENEIVNEEIIQDPLCMNLKIGGSGGFNKENSLKGTKIMNSKIWKDSEFRERHTGRLKKLHSEGKLKLERFDWTNKTHTEETKKKMSESSRGKGLKENNSQFGTRWITNGIENKKIKKEEKIPDGWKLGRIK